MPQPKLYRCPAEKQAAYRIRKTTDMGKAESWARRKMAASGYDMRQWHFCHQWESGKTLWSSDTDDGYCVLADPDAGTVRKMRST